MDHLPPSPEPLEEPLAPPAGPASAGWKSWLAAGVVATVVVAGGVTFMHRSDGDGADVEAAATDGGTGPVGPGGAGGPGRGTAGEITAIDGTTLTIDSTDQSGTVTGYTVVTNADTTLTESTEGAVADVAVGDNVVVIGTPATDGVVAMTILDSGDLENAFGAGPGGPPGGAGQVPPDGVELPSGVGAPPTGAFGGGFTAGAVTSVDGDTFTVETADGDPVMVTTTADTTVNVTEAVELADLAVGDSVRVSGTTEDTTITATAIQVGDAGFRLGGFADGLPPQGTDAATDDTTT